MKIKEITQTDIPTLLELIKELAKYEHLLDQVSANDNLLTQWIIKKRKRTHYYSNIIIRL